MLNIKIFIKMCVILWFFILTISVCSTVSRTSQTNHGCALTVTLYVDDNNTQGPWDGSLAHPYQRIQDGIDHSNTGDTIFVFSGLYLEHVTVTTTVSLIGEQKETTIIDAGNISHCIYLEAGNVQIRGFTLRNSGMHPENGDGGVGLRNGEQSSHSNIIQDNIFTDNFYGVSLWFSDNNTVANNLFIHNKWTSIQLYSINSDNKIINNTITEGGIGIFLGDMGCSDTLVQGNLIENHYKGIMCSEADHSLITHNVIRDNTHSGIMFAIGCDRNTISYNIIEGNNESGILIEYSSCSMTTIENNDFINNTMYGVASIGPWTRILHNYITGSEYGIAMQGHYSTIHSNNLMNNKLGVQIETAAPSDVTDNIFIGNSLDASFSDMFFEHFLYFFVYQPRLIRWSGNYWGEPLSQPKIISGTMVIFGMHIPWVNVDFRPASEPQGTWRTQ